MNIAAKILLAIGFLLSIVTNGSLLLIFTAFYALYTYLASIVFRALGWIASSSISRFNILTGVAVLIFGGGILAGGMGDITTLIFLWSVYTVVEAVTYFRLKDYSKLYLIAMVSLISVAMALYLVIVENIAMAGDYDDVLPNFQLIFVVNMVSALFAALGTLLAKKPIEPPEVGG